MRSTYWRKSDQSSFTAKLAACSCNMQMSANDIFILTNWNSMCVFSKGNLLSNLGFINVYGVLYQKKVALDRRLELLSR